MKFDYEYSRNILQAMEDYPSKRIFSNDLFEKTVLNHAENRQEKLDKFIGHIQLLWDNDCIDIDTIRKELGYRYMSKGNIIEYGSYYRLTSKGYDFLSALNQPGVLQKVKDVALSVGIGVAIEILSSWVKTKIMIN
jgi:hypothetical protein